MKKIKPESLLGSLNLSKEQDDNQEWYVHPECPFCNRKVKGIENFKRILIDHSISVTDAILSVNKLKVKGSKGKITSHMGTIIREKSTLFCYYIVCNECSNKINEEEIDIFIEGLVSGMISIIQENGEPITSYNVLRTI